MIREPNFRIIFDFRPALIFLKFHSKVCRMSLLISDFVGKIPIPVMLESVIERGYEYWEKFKRMNCLRTQIRNKITAISWICKYYSISNCMFQFKTHIWELIGINMGRYFHAASYLLEKVDKAHDWFLRELHVTSAHASMEYAFAPSNLKRNIGSLDFLQKRMHLPWQPVANQLDYHMDPKKTPRSLIEIKYNFTVREISGLSIEYNLTNKIFL